MTTTTIPVGDMVDLAYGRSLSASMRKPGPVPVFGSNGQVGSHESAAVDGPGIVVGRKGSVGALAYSSGPFWPIDTTYYVVNKGGHDWRYLYHLLRSLGLTKLNSHSAVPGLNREDVYCIDVIPFSPDEERHIGAALDCVERSVMAEGSAIDALRRLKRAAMREVFSKGLRAEAQKETEIGPLPESWDIVPLGSLGRIGSGTTPDRKNAEFWSGGTVPWITSGMMYQREIEGSDQLVTQAAIRAKNLPMLQPGAVLIAIVGQGKTLGHCAVLKVSATVSRHVGYFQPNLTRADTGYIRTFLEGQYDYLRQLASGNGSTRAALTGSTLKGLLIPLPPTLAEQQEIATVIDAIDAKIDLHRRKQTLLEELFHSLLHKLMTGEIRVADLDLSALADPPETECIA